MRRIAKSALLGGLLEFFCAVVALKGAALLVPSGTWAPEGTMANARSGASAALLPDGRILITGGDTGSGPAVTADILDTIGATSAAPPMVNARTKHVSVTLPDGRVLVAGGITAGGSATNTAEIFDPIANSWTNVGTGMTEARSGATAAVLLDGRVIVAGGQNGTAISSTIEIFDPALGVFTPAGMMAPPRTQHAMAVLQDGRVLIVGGNNGTGPVASANIFDPVTGMVSAGPSLATARFGHSATTLLNGQVLVIGGNNGNANPLQMDMTPAELFDPAAGTFSTLATNLATPREGHLAILLPNNNNVLIVGGTSGGATIASAELFSQWQGTFAATGTMATARSSAASSGNQVSGPTSLMQGNGLVMVAGGADAGGNALNTTEAYGYPTVQTDQGDYPPGSTVTITGSGWKPGETVTLTLVESPLFDTHPVMIAVADAGGNIVNTQFSPDTHDIDIRFYLTAAGGTSGFQAQTTFTDAQVQSVTVASPTSATVNAGATAVYGTVTVSLNGNSTVCTVTLGASGLPSGATAVFGNSPFTSNSSGTSSLSVNTTPATATGSHTFQVTATQDANCQHAGDVTSSGNLTLIVNALAPTTMAVSTASGTYGGTVNLAATLTKTSDGSGVSGQTIAFTLNGNSVGSAVTNGSGVATLSGVSLAGINASTYTGGAGSGVGASFAAAGGFVASSGTATLTVGKRAITVTAATNTKGYDGTTSAAATPTITSGTLAPGDTANFTESYGTKNVGTGLTLTPTGTVTDGNSGNNYAVTFVNNTTGVISARPITVTAASDTKTYDGTTTSTGTPTITSGTLASGDTTTNFTQVFDSRNASAVNGRTLTASGTVSDGNSGNNYAYTFVTATGTINKRAITVTAATDTKIYDGTTSSTGTPTITSGTLATGDTTTNFTQVFDSRNASTTNGRTLTASGTVNDGNGGANYAYTFATATGTITKRPITVTAATDTKVYDGTTSSTGAPTITLGSLATGDATTNFTQVFDSRNASAVNGRTLTASGTVNDGNGGANYAYTFATATGTITKRPITVTAASDTKIYDGTTSSTGTPTITLGSLATGDTTTSFTQVFDSRNASATNGRTLTASGTVTDGNSGANYAYTFATALGTINKRPITVTAASDTKTYDGTTSSTGAPTITLGSLATGDTTTNFTQVFDSRNASATNGRTLTASGTVTDGNSGANYAYTFATALGTINKRPITVTAASDTKTYDGTTSSTGAPTITLGGLATGDTTTNFTQVFDSRNASTTNGRTLTASGTVNDGNSGANYAYTFATALGTINKRPITVTAASDTKIYDGTTSSTGAPTITLGSLASGDTTTSFTQVFDSRNASATNGRTLTASGTVNDGNSGANYAYTFATALGTINKRPITVTAASDTKTYDGTTSSTGTPTITLGSLATGDTTTSFTQVFDSRNASATNGRTLTASGTVNDGNGGANYAYTFATALGTINRRPITVTAASDTKTYDGTTTSTGTPTITLGSLATGDTTTNFTQVFDSRNAGSRTLTPSGTVNDGNAGDNYAYTFTTASGTITKRPITVTAASDTKIYDGTTSSTGAPAITLGSLATGDTTTSFTQVFDSRNAGPRTLTPSGIVNDGNGGANYAYTFTTASGTISKRPITVMAASDTKQYDGTTSSIGSPTITFGTLATGDTTTSFTQVFDSRNAGPRTLTPSGTVNDGNAGDNYAYTFTTASGSITKRPITATAASDTKIYDGTTSSTGTPTITLGSLATGDTTTTFTQVFDSRNAGPRTLTPSGTVNDGNAGDNYAYTFATASGSISKRPITVMAASDTKQYDGTTSSAGSPTITFGTLASGDTTTSFTQVFDSRNVGPRTLTPSGMVNDGNGGANYMYTFTTASGSITARPITVMAASDTKPYDGTTSSAGSPTITLGSLASGDATTSFTQVFDSRNAGPRMLTPSGTVNDGNGGTNYMYTFTTASGSITKRAITVMAASDTKPYDGTTSSTGGPTITVGSLASGDTTTNFTQVFDSRNAGPRTLTPSGTVNDGNSGLNYAYTFTTASGSITARAITVMAASDTKPYDGTTSSTGAPTITVGSLASGDTTTNFTQVFDSRNAGPRTLTPSGVVNDGNSGLNYAYTFTTASGSITARAITVTAASDTKVYDGNTSSVGVPMIAPALISPDTANFTQIFDSRNAGSRTLTPSGSVNDGNGGHNYVVTFAPVNTGVITKSPLNISAVANTKTFDGTTSAAAAPTVSGLKDTDTATGLIEVYDNSNAGTGKTLTVSTYTVNDGNGGNNYSVHTFTNTAGVITAAVTTTTVGASANPSTFGQAVTFTATVTNTQTSPIPTGSVQFKIDGVNFGVAVALSAGGTASVSTSTLATGSHTVVAVYTNADGNFVGSTSSTLTQQVNFGFAGFGPPYAPPPTTFNVTRTMPLKWQYTNSSGSVVNSSAANPVIIINGPYACGGSDTAGTITVNDAGASGYQYDPGSNSWQFNWQIKGNVAGCYDIYVKSQQSGQTNGAFPISLVNK